MLCIDFVNILLTRLAIERISSYLSFALLSILFHGVKTLIVQNKVEIITEV